MCTSSGFHEEQGHVEHASYFPRPLTIQRDIDRLCCPESRRSRANSQLSRKKRSPDQGQQASLLYAARLPLNRVPTRVPDSAAPPPSFHAATESFSPRLTATPGRPRARRQPLVIGRGEKIGAGQAATAATQPGHLHLHLQLQQQRQRQRVVRTKTRSRSKAKSRSPAIVRSPSTPDPSTIFNSRNWTAVNFWPPPSTTSHPHKLFQGQPNVQDFVPPHSPDRPPPLGFSQPPRPG